MTERKTNNNICNLLQNTIHKLNAHNTNLITHVCASMEIWLYLIRFYTINHTYYHKIISKNCT